MIETSTYYSITDIKAQKADYNIIHGERVGGKSWQVKVEVCLKDYIACGYRIFLIRRWDDKSMRISAIEGYFSDNKQQILELTNGRFDSVKAYAGELYLVNSRWKKKDAREKAELFGYYGALVYAETLKSNNMYYENNVINFVFEEYASTKGYIPNEPEELMNLISTIARDRKVKVWLIGNTLTRNCPYYSYWELTHAQHQKPNTIEKYTFIRERKDGTKNEITVAVERTDVFGNDTMSFGNASKNIVGGEWIAYDKPHFNERDLDKYHMIYTIVICSVNVNFLCRLLIDKDTCDSPFWYVCYKTSKIPYMARTISTRESELFLPYNTPKLIPLTDSEKVAFNFFKLKRIRYCNNLCGTEFEQVLSEIM